MKKFSPSKFQKNIFNFILNDKRNLIISAVAGSGKTTTLLKALEIIPEDKSVLFLAFNLSIANELKERTPKDRYNITVSTVHSFGMKTLTKSFYPQVNTKKYREILKYIIDVKSGKKPTNLKSYDLNDEQKDYMKIIYNLIPNKDDKKDFTKNVLELCNLSRLNLVNFDIKSIGIIEINEIARKYSIDNFDNESTVAWFLSKIGLQSREEIDYTDMVSLPNILNIEPEKYDFVFIDESQDLNASQRGLMLKAIKNDGGRFISVGDERQAIYAFAGADHESYQKLKNIPNTVELPLSFTYRVAPEILNMVKHINPTIIAHPKNRPGRVYETFSYKNIEDGDMVLCRITFPLVSLCLRLLTEGKKAFVVGSDIGESLINMIISTKKENMEFNMDNVFSSLIFEKEKLIEKIMNKHNMSRNEAMGEQKFIIYDEKIQQIEALSYDINDPEIVINKIHTIFSDEKKTGIRLSTIHKSKGLESERVFIIHEDLMPLKSAKQPWELQQETNLIYVAYTRAKTTLGFVNDFNAFKQQAKREIKQLKTSEHVHPINKPIVLKLKVIKAEKKEGRFGAQDFYLLVDDDGNFYEKWGTIDSLYLVGGISGRLVEIGSSVTFKTEITKHTEYMGIKYNRIGRLKMSDSFTSSI